MRSVRIHSRPFLDSVIALLISCFVIYVRTGWLGLNEGLDNWVKFNGRRGGAKATTSGGSLLVSVFHAGIYFWAKEKSP